MTRAFSSSFLRLGGSCADNIASADQETNGRATAGSTNRVLMSGLLDLFLQKSDLLIEIHGTLEMCLNGRID